MIAFFIPTEPQGKKTPTATLVHGRARVLKSAKTRKYEDLISVFASHAMHGAPPLDVPMSIAIVAVMSVPKSWSQRKQREALAGIVKPTSKPDLSNILKSCEDGCNGIVFRDDALIVEAAMQKVYGDTPGIRVRIWAAEVPVLETQLAQLALVD